MATAYLSNELDGIFGTQTLIPLLLAQRNVARELGLIAAGATPVGNGFGRFVEFALSPSEVCLTVSECSHRHTNTNVIIPSAAGTMAGVLGTPEAIDNLIRLYDAAVELEQFDDTFGFLTIILIQLM